VTAATAGSTPVRVQRFSDVTCSNELRSWINNLTPDLPTFPADCDDVDDVRYEELAEEGNTYVGFRKEKKNCPCPATFSSSLNN
jgi:hypothetical protein